MRGIVRIKNELKNTSNVMRAVLSSISTQILAIITFMRVDIHEEIKQRQLHFSHSVPCFPHNKCHGQLSTHPYADLFILNTRT